MLVRILTAAFLSALFVSGPALVSAGVEMDFDGDGKTDPTVRTDIPTGPDTYQTYYYTLLRTGGYSATPWGGFDSRPSGYVDSPLPADYDGDGKTDLAVGEGPATRTSHRSSACSVISTFCTRARTHTLSYPSDVPQTDLIGTGHSRRITTVMAKPISPSHGLRGPDSIFGYFKVGTDYGWSTFPTTRTERSCGAIMTATARRISGYKAERLYAELSL